MTENSLNHIYKAVCCLCVCRVGPLDMNVKIGGVNVSNKTLEKYMSTLSGYFVIVEL